MKVIIFVAMTLAFLVTVVLAHQSYDQAAMGMCLAGLGCGALLVWLRLRTEWKSHGWIGVARQIVGAVLQVIGIAVLFLISILRNRDPKFSHVVMKNVIEKAILDAWFPLPNNRSKSS